jgi:hypothetical protein
MNTADADHQARVATHYAAHPSLVSWHEAAHAAVAAALGWRILSVEASWTGHHGVTTMTAADDATNVDRLAIHMAGVRGERRSPSWDPDLAAYSGVEDREEVDRLACQMGLRTLGPLEQAVDDLLRDHHDGLARLAAALVRRRWLDGREAIALLTGKPG